MADRNVLAALIEAVEKGSVDEVDRLACALFHGTGQCRDVVNAYHGSLDAAKALHEALLPGWWYVVDHKMSSVSDPEDGPFYNAISYGNAARAWLLAVLRALVKIEFKEASVA